jgi:hypothetical protein
MYVVNLSRNLVVGLGNNKSYISHSILTDSGFVVAGGYDHRIGLFNLRETTEWTPLTTRKRNQGDHGVSFEACEINSSKVVCKTM